MAVPRQLCPSLLTPRIVPLLKLKRWGSVTKCTDSRYAYMRMISGRGFLHMLGCGSIKLLPVISRSRTTPLALADTEQTRKPEVSHRHSSGNNSRKQRHLRNTMPGSDPLPTIAIIPGAWQNTENYAPLRQALADRGYDTVCQSPPSVTLSHGDTDLEADANFVHDQVLLPLIEHQCKDVVVLLHSFAGVYGSCGVKGLAKSTRAHADKRGGVVALLYLASPCVPAGVSTLQLMGVGEDLLPWVELDVRTCFLPFCPGPHLHPVNIRVC
jgi:hypothetical protein